jgi:RNA polymerase sigma factor (TIGR02999 family)
MEQSQQKSKEITGILNDWSKGNQEAFDALLPLIYDELHRQAERFLRRERAGHTLQTTALINETYLKLIDQREVNWQNRAHFFGIASNMMRRILIDHARAHATEKRGGAAIRLSVDDVQIPLDQRAADFLALDEALKELAKFDERKARIVEMRFFGGLTDEEIAEVLSVTSRTVWRDWRAARLWLYRELNEDR